MLDIIVKISSVFSKVIVLDNNARIIVLEVDN